MSIDSIVTAAIAAKARACASGRRSGDADDRVDDHRVIEWVQLVPGAVEDDDPQHGGVCPVSPV